MQLKMIDHPGICGDSTKTVSHPVSCLKLVWAGTNNIKTAQNVLVYARSVFPKVGNVAIVYIATNYVEVCVNSR